MEKILLNKRKDDFKNSFNTIESEEEIISKKLKVVDEESNNIVDLSSSQSSIIKFTRSFEHVDGNWPAFIYLKGKKVIYIYKFILLIYNFNIL